MKFQKIGGIDEEFSRKMFLIGYLHDVRYKFSEFSNEYLTSCDICYKIGLTAYNFASYKY